MSLKTLVRLAPTVLILSGLAAVRPAAAQFITFGAAQTISGVSDVSTTGTLVDAYDFSGSSATVNGVSFSSMASVGGTGNLSIIGGDYEYGYYGAGGSSTTFGSLDSSYQSLLTNGLYVNSSNPFSFTESGLTAGHRYQVQYFVNDSRSLASGRTETVTSSGGNSSQPLLYNSTVADGGVGQFVNGTFTAATSAVTMNATSTSSAQINGLQFRDLGNAGAAITFGTPIAIGTADATLGGIAGTIITAADFGAGSQTVTLTGGQTINFDGNGANATVVGGNGTTAGALNGTILTGNTAFDTVLDGFNYDSAAGTKQITLSGLTAGQQYSLQLFGLDDRSGSIARTLSFSDFSGDSSGLITSGANDYVLGTFTALSSFETITESVPSGGNINALVVRDLTVSAAPEPSQFACLAFTALGMAGLLLKARKRTASVKLS